ncbi:MAG TPA: hypothetical protein EYP19_16455 [Desulfobacterales bacterium]|nr:hypothetical protein [Desulfobacterales bacterium]
MPSIAVIALEEGSLYCLDCEIGAGGTSQNSKAKVIKGTSGSVVSVVSDTKSAVIGDESFNTAIAMTNSELMAYSQASVKTQLTSSADLIQLDGDSRFSIRDTIMTAPTFARINGKSHFEAVDSSLAFSGSTGGFTLFHVDEQSERPAVRLRGDSKVILSDAVNIRFLDTRGGVALVEKSVEFCGDGSSCGKAREPKRVLNCNVVGTIGTTPTTARLLYKGINYCPSH